jgi:hypothetical protein
VSHPLNFPLYCFSVFPQLTIQTYDPGLVYIHASQPNYDQDRQLANRPNILYLLGQEQRKPGRTQLVDELDYDLDRLKLI